GGGRGELVAVDLPGARIGRLRENLEKLRKRKNIKYTIIEKDVKDLSLGYFESLNLPDVYDVVVLDAPCSNTGVLRRRVDAKWRLEEKDITRMADIQFELLVKSALFVKPGGRLVYSTCSIEREENMGVVEKFINQHGEEFELKKSIVSYPWMERHDGGGGFLLIRKVNLG
ncbi:MAG: RNA methyltransferase, partial [Verrucomicrobia bacterium]